jgi:hypothetical protein
MATMIRSFLAHVGFASLLLACGSGAAIAPQTPAKPEAPVFSAIGPVDGVACVGVVAEAPLGAKEVSDEALAALATGATGKGKLCTARVFEAIAPMKVYRVWNSEKSYTEIGSWWSFDKPAGPTETYRAQNAVCPEWSALDRLSVCEIKIGARFAMGPGQSATCEGDKEYPKSPVNQVFIPNDTRERKVYVEHCAELGAWP